MSEVQSKIAAGLVTLQSPLFAALPYILNNLQVAIHDKLSSKIRSKGLAGLEQLMKKDARVIGEATIKNLIPSLKDNSPMVRDSTLSLVANFLEVDPTLERFVLPSILAMTTDGSNAPKKKAIKLVKDIYLRSTSKKNKLDIVAALLPPSQDVENSISELARGVLGEIWFTAPTYTAGNSVSQLKLDRAQRAFLMVDIIEYIQKNAAYMQHLVKYLSYALSSQAGSYVANARICRDIVADLLDEATGPNAGSDGEAQARILNALSIFAKVDPSLFTLEQVQLLKLYIKEITTEDDLSLVRPTVVIYRHVFSTLSCLQQDFAIEVRASLMRNVSKLARWAAQASLTSRETLEDVVYCLWAIDTTLNMGGEQLCNTVVSVLVLLKPLLDCSKEQAAADPGKIKPYLILLGTFGKVCNLDWFIETFRGKLHGQAQIAVTKKQATQQQMENFLKEKDPISGGKSSASLLLLDTVRPFTSQHWNSSIRQCALSSLGGICQQSPDLFTRAEVQKILQLVFVNKDHEQLRIVLSFLNDYFTFAERRSESAAQIATGQGDVNGSARLEVSFVATGNDNAPLNLSNKFLPYFVNTALATRDNLAYLAASIIASISRQGLCHPKNCGAALAALSTSLETSIAQLASEEHKRIHEKQESYLEKEYMQAIRMAFKYQRDVFGDSHGMLQSHYSPKLVKLFEAMKSGKRATFKKFVSNLCKQIDFELTKLDASGPQPEPVLFARFCLENLALLDFASLEILSIFLNATEAMVLKHTGPAVALVIETEMPKQSVGPEHGVSKDAIRQPPQDSAHLIPLSTTSDELALPSPRHSNSNVDDARLRQITTACMILQMVWDTRHFVRRCYNLLKLRGHISPKDYTKSAIRNNLVSGKELWEVLAPTMNALDNRETMLKQCYDFADLLEVDREAMVGEDEDELGLGLGYETPTELDDDVNGVAIPTSGRGRKRKSNVSLANTPKKARGRPAGTKNKKRLSNSGTPDGDDDSD